MTAVVSDKPNDPMHFANLKRQDARRNKLMKLFWICAVLLAFRVLYLIVKEYPLYFPADFQQSAFLTGRREFFSGIYRTAFYVHIVIGPATIVLAIFLLFTGLKARSMKLHRTAGQLLVGLTVLLLAPTGLVMATRAYTGLFAGIGFATLSILTAASALVTLFLARQRKFKRHQVWAIRTFILLCSPLILRLMSGVFIVTDLESPWTYRINAWLSWLLPLLLFEIWRSSLRGSRAVHFKFLRREV